jgi:MFS transporter, DHA1 family, tetracycline resistance protein
LFNFAFRAMVNNSSVYLIERFAIQPVKIALLFTFLGVVNVVFQGVVVQKAAPRWGERRMGLYGLAILALAYLAFPFASSLWAVLLMGNGNAFTEPALGALAANKASGKEQGQIAGVSTSITTLASMFGPLWAGAA